MTWEEYKSIVNAIEEKQKEYRRNAEEDPNHKNVYLFMDAGLTIAWNIIGVEYMKSLRKE